MTLYRLNFWSVFLNIINFPLSDRLCKCLFYIVIGLLIFNWLFALAKRKKGLSAY